MQYRHSFTVVGFLFPIDMMRYDRCTPATEKDSHALADCLGVSDEQPVFCKVRMVHIGERRWQPTFGRWASFGMAIVGLFGAPSKDGTARGIVTSTGITYGPDDYPETTKL